MESTATVWSQAFLDRDEEPVALLPEERWRDLEEVAGRRFLRLQAGGATVVCAVGSPVRTDFPADAVFLPLWLMDRLGATDGQTVEALLLEADAIPPALQIVLRPHDSAFYDVAAVKESLETALTRVGVLTAGSDIPLELEGGRHVFHIVATEPASTVLCDGEEVAIEFEEAADRFDGRPAPEPAPEPPRADSEEEDELFRREIPDTRGQRLGGVVRAERHNPWRQVGFKPQAT